MKPLAICLTILAADGLNSACCELNAAEPFDIGTRRELFVDEHLIERMTGGACLELHRPDETEMSLCMTLRGKAIAR